MPVGCPADGSGDSVVGQPQNRFDRTRTDGVDPHPPRAEFPGRDLQKLVRAPLAAPATRHPQRSCRSRSRLCARSLHGMAWVAGLLVRHVLRVPVRPGGSGCSISSSCFPCAAAARRSAPASSAADRVDVGDDQVQSLRGSRYGRGDPGFEDDRAHRAQRCQLHHPEVLTCGVVGILPPAQCL
jgi:hypothetical protein